VANWCQTPATVWLTYAHMECHDITLVCVKKRKVVPTLPSASSFHFALPVLLHRARAATGGEPVVATKKSTASKHHHLIPPSSSRTLSSSTSLTSPCNPIDSGRAHRAFGSTAVAIVASKPSSHVSCLSGPLPPLLSSALCPPWSTDAHGVGH
jgi:hypothetical protein